MALRPCSRRGRARGVLIHSRALSNVPHPELIIFGLSSGVARQILSIAAVAPRRTSTRLLDAMDASQTVWNGGALVEAMGRWPSFHDANVLETSREAGTFAVKIHLFSMTSQIDSAGYYVLEKHHLVTLVMQDVQSNSLPSDYTDDCLAGLTFSRTGDLIQVDFESHMEQGGSVVCRKVEITDVVPCTSVGVALAPN